MVGLELEPSSANVQPTAHLAVQAAFLPSCLWSSSEFGHYDIRNVDMCIIHQMSSKNFTLLVNPFL